MNIQTIKIAITMEKGGVAIMDFVIVGRGNMLPFGGKWTDEAMGWWKREPTDENIKHQIKRAVSYLGKTTGYRIINEKDLPADRHFRDAWQDSKKKIVVDIDKAKEIQKDKLRARRAPLLAELDTAYLRADEAGDIALKNKIISQKQALRDITKHPDFKKAKTPEQIKAIRIIV
jgi:hypothetical protein